MAGFVKWATLGFLLVLSVTEAARLDPPAPARTCKQFTLISTIRKNDKVVIKDDDGKPADILSVTVKKQISNTQCRDGDNIIIREPEVIATDGCQARVEVCYRAFNEPEPTVSPGCKLVRLLSRLNREATEDQDSRIVSMKLVRQFPQGVDCNSRVNYGFRNHVAWARGGCRADFEVCTRDNPGDLQCDIIVVKSTRFSRKEYEVLDNNGSSVDIVSVEVDEQISSTRCVEYETYTYNDTFVVARRGCQARFKVCYQKAGPEPTSRPGCIRVRLISKPNKIAKVRYPLEQGRIVSINPVIRFPGTRCANYGIRGQEVFASSGCKAEFEVCLVGGTVTVSPLQTCVNVNLASTRNYPDWTKISRRDGPQVVISSIRLVSEDSDVDCVQPDTFYIKNQDEVHAIKGCQGTFRVCYSRLD